MMNGSALLSVLTHRVINDVQSGAMAAHEDVKICCVQRSPDDIVGLICEGSLESLNEIVRTVHEGCAGTE